MGNRRVSVDGLADAVIESLREYAALATDDMKKAVRETGKTVKQEIIATAPRDTGAYAKSWAIKSVKETSDSLEVVVHSKKRYRLTHLLEHGHAKRGGGRVAGRPHIAPAEQKGIEQLEREIERSLRNG